MKRTTTEVFVAKDGKVFLTEAECLSYEQLLLRDKLYEFLEPICNNYWSDDFGSTSLDTDDVVTLIMNYFETIKNIIEG